MPTQEISVRPTIDVNKNGIQTRFDFKVEETPAKKAFKQIKKKRSTKSQQLQLLERP